MNRVYIRLIFNVVWNIFRTTVKARIKTLFHRHVIPPKDFLLLISRNNLRWIELAFFIWPFIKPCCLWNHPKSHYVLDSFISMQKFYRSSRCPTCATDYRIFFLIVYIFSTWFLTISFSRIGSFFKSKGVWICWMLIPL